MNNYFDIEQERINFEAAIINLSEMEESEFIKISENFDINVMFNLWLAAKRAAVAKS